MLKKLQQWCFRALPDNSDCFGFCKIWVNSLIICKEWNNSLCARLPYFDIWIYYLLLFQGYLTIVLKGRTGVLNITKIVLIYVYQKLINISLVLLLSFSFLILILFWETLMRSCAAQPCPGHWRVSNISSSASVYASILRRRGSSMLITQIVSYHISWRGGFFFTPYCLIFLGGG